MSILDIFRKKNISPREQPKDEFKELYEQTNENLNKLSAQMDELSKQISRKNNPQKQIETANRVFDDIYGRMKQLDDAPGNVRASQIAYEGAQILFKELGLENVTQEQTNVTTDLEQLENWKTKIVNLFSSNYINSEIKEKFLFMYLDIKSNIIGLNEDERNQYRKMHHIFYDRYTYRELILYYHLFGLFNEKEFIAFETMKKIDSISYDKLISDINKIIEEQNQFYQRYNDVLEFRKILEDGNIETSGYASKYADLTEDERKIIFYAYISDKRKFDLFYSSDEKEKKEIEKKYLGPGRPDLLEMRKLYDKSLNVCSKLGIINEISRGMYR